MIIYYIKFIITDAACKRRWINIRDQFKKSLNRRKTRAADTILKQYKYEKILQFLMPHIQERTTISNTELSVGENQSDSETLNSQTVAPVNSESYEQSNLNESTANIHQQLPRKKRENVVDGASATLMKYMIQENGKQQNQNDTHPMDAFLNGLAPTLRNLPPYYQHLAKGKIFSVVQELEAQAFFASENHRHTPQSPDGSSWSNIPVLKMEYSHTQLEEMS